MKCKLFIIAVPILSAYVGWSQDRPADRQAVPIYRVTVVERTVKAVDYQYRNGPTRVDFRGTVLLPQAKGDAIVESKAGRAEIDAHLERVTPPTRYGREYLTYVLWAITPEGHAKNLGEVMANSSDHAHLRVTTDLQSFGMIVTAEPYAAVRQPSDVVVMENEIRPDTIGHIEMVRAKYELLPRGEYTYNVPVDVRAVEGSGPSLPMDQYEALVEVYQAQNAVQIARSQHADQYAPDTFQKAEALMRQAQDFQARRVDRSTVVTLARQAAQTAEDSRMIAAQKRQADELAQARQQAANEQSLRVQAEAEAQRARGAASADRAQVEADRVQLESERVARQRSEAEASVLREPPPPPPLAQTPAPAPAVKTEMRVRLLQELNAAAICRDSPRGLVVTIPDADFHGSYLNPAYSGTVVRVAQILAAHPGVVIEVDGHTDNSLNGSRAETVSYERAAAVRDALVRSGVPANIISARGLGSSRPIVSNASPAGREQNRRVEITISGEVIGSLPYWDRTYAVAPRR